MPVDLCEKHQIFFHFCLPLDLVSFFLTILAISKITICYILFLSRFVVFRFFAVMEVVIGSEKQIYSMSYVYIIKTLNGTMAPNLAKVQTHP